MASRSRILQNPIIVWLDPNIDESGETFQNFLEHVNRIVGSFEIFNDFQACIEFIDAIKDEKIFLIISGACAQKIIPEIHDKKQLDSIYVLCSNKKLDEEWSRNGSKVRGIHADIKSIGEQLQKDRVRFEEDTIRISFSGIDPSFIYTQLLKESLVDLDDDNQQQAIDKLVSYCRDHSNIPENDLMKFKEQYKADKAIWWYTNDSFLYRMLNCALRTFDIDTILIMGFFIRHLHRQLEAERQKQDLHNKPFKVYRGQGLSQENLHKLQNTKSSLISFNSFLSTSQKEQVSLNVAKSSLDDANNVGIVFVMQIDPSRCRSIPFARLAEQERILFSTHTIFRVDKIEQIHDPTTNRLWRVELSLTDENENEHNEFAKTFRDEVINLNKWDRIGRILIKSGQPGQAMKLYEILLESAQNDTDKALYNNQLGWVNDDMGKYSIALEYYEKARNMREKSLSVNHPSLGATYRGIGLVYSNMGEYSKALEFYEKASGTYEKCLPTNHPDLAALYNNIGNVYLDKGDYLKSLEFYGKTFDIWQKCLPPNHPDLAGCYSNLGNVYLEMSDDSKALEFYEKACVMREKMLPANHPDLASSYNNIAIVYDNIGENSQALEFYEKARAIREISLPTNHPDLASSCNNIGALYSKMGEYSKALEYYEKARDMREKSLPMNHPDVAQSYSNIGSIHSKNGECSKALEYYEKARDMREKSLPAEHPHLAASYNNIGVVYNKMGEYAKALEYFERARDAWAKSLPENHPDLRLVLKNISVVQKRL